MKNFLDEQKPSDDDEEEEEEEEEIIIAHVSTEMLKMAMPVAIVND